MFFFPFLVSPDDEIYEAYISRSEFWGRFLKTRKKQQLTDTALDTTL